jgi:DNA polymerase-3 subunit delta
MFYLLHGEDEYSRSLELAKMKVRLGDPTTVDLNITILDGRKATLDELMHACNTVPFLAERRLVVVDDLAARFEPGSPGRREDSESEQDRAFLQGLGGYLSRLPESARLIFRERRRVPKRNPIYRFVLENEHGYAKEFNRPRGRALDRWIARRVEEKNGRIETGAISLLAAFVGNDLRLLDHEIDKLLSYTGEERPITERDVQTLVSYVREADIFQMVDALGKRDSREAMKLLHRLLEEGQPPLYLLHMIARQFRILLRVKELMGKGTSAADVRTLLGLHPFVVDKITKQAPNFSIAQLEAIYHRLLEIDLAVKTGRMEPGLALSVFVTELQR